VKVLLYGRLAEAIDRQIEIEGGCSVTELRARLANSFPAAAVALGRARACVDDVLVDDHHLIATDDQVELLPPVSGG
jgi:molybdopterin synthase sulfur carrier subunit